MFDKYDENMDVFDEENTIPNPNGMVVLENGHALKSLTSRINAEVTTIKDGWGKAKALKKVRNETIRGLIVMSRQRSRGMIAVVEREVSATVNFQTGRIHRDLSVACEALQADVNALFRDFLIRANLDTSVAEMELAKLGLSDARNITEIEKSDELSPELAEALRASSSRRILKSLDDIAEHFDKQCKQVLERLDIVLTNFKTGLA